MVSGSRELAVYTTVYPGVEKFLPDWYASLRSQTDQDFDLWVGLDGLTPKEAGALMGGEPDVRWAPSQAGDTPATVRERAFEQIVSRHGSVVFVDSDDVLLPDRVAAARAALEASDVAGCALHVVDEDARDTGVIFGTPPGTDWADFLPRYNVFGMSNTAYRSETLARCLPVPPAGRLVDWLLAMRASLLGARLSFDAVPRMKYRQYSGNVARMLPPFRAEDIVSAADRVATHHAGLLDTAWSVPPAKRPRLEAERERVESFRTRMRASEGLLEDYVHELGLLPARPVWWWCVAHPELEWMWNN
jgi:hypothetical protein